MKTRAFMIGALVMSLVFVAGGLCWAAGETGKRQIRQHKRISRGVTSGEITDREVTRLNREQSRILRAKRRVRSDERIGPQERRRVRRMQDRASEHIFRAKHNRKVRYNHHYRRRAPMGFNHYKHRRPHPYRYHPHRYHLYRGHRPPQWRHHDSDDYYPEPSSDYDGEFSGTISQPEFSIAWSVNLD